MGSSRPQPAAQIRTDEPPDLTKAVGVTPIGIGARRPSSVVVGPVHLPLGGAVESQQAVVPDANVGKDGGTPELDFLLRAEGFTSLDDLLDANKVPKLAYRQPEDIGAIKGLAISGLVYVGAVLSAGLTAAAAPFLVPMLDDIATALACTVSSARTRVHTLGIRRRKLKAGSPQFGNAGWLVGDSLRAAMPFQEDDFASDLLSKLE